MATSNLPTPSLAPVTDDDKAPLTIVAEEGGSCCGGGCCGGN